jgi:hypothetical protein
MTNVQLKSKRYGTRPGAARVRWLVVTLVAVSASCAVVALLAGGDARAVFGAVALVFAIAAIWSAVEVITSGRDEPRFDMEAPPEVTPLPQSPVSQTYDPGVPPNNSLERTRDG